MGRKQKTVEQNEFDSVDDNEIEEMLEIEREIRASKQPDTTTQNSSNSKSKIKEKWGRVKDSVPIVDVGNDDLLTGTIVAVSKSYRYLKFTVHTSDGTKTVKIPQPDNWFDDETEFAQLCDYCRVDPESFANLQGKEVKLKRMDRHAGWKFCLPTSTNLAASTIFETWFAIQMYCNINELKKTIVLGAMSVPALLTLKGLLADTTTDAEVAAAMLPFLYSGTETLSQLDTVGIIIFVCIGVVSSILLALLTINFIGKYLLQFIVKLHNFVKENISPF